MIRFNLFQLWKLIEGDLRCSLLSVPPLSQGPCATQCGSFVSFVDFRCILVNYFRNRWLESQKLQQTAID